MMMSLMTTPKISKKNNQINNIVDILALHMLRYLRKNV